MGGELDELLRSIPPPAGVSPANWGAVEKKLGLRLPTDYKALCDAYGDSHIGDEVRLWAPQSTSKANRFPAAALAENVSLRERRASQGPTSIPNFRGWRFHPEEKGLLPWGLAGGVVAFLLVDPVDDPDAWRVVASGFSSGEDIAILRVTEDAGLAAFVLRAALERARAKEGASDGVEAEWTRIKLVFEFDYPEALEALRPGADEAAIAAAEAELGVQLPAPFRESLHLHDGQDPRGPWLVDGGQLNSLEDLLRDWRDWMGMQARGELDGFAADAEPDAGIRDDLWWRPGWLPFVSQDGDHLVLDLDPAPEGEVGQVFAFSHASGPGRLAAPDFATWLEIWAGDLEGGAAFPSESPFASEDDDGDDEDDEDEDEDDRGTSRTWPL